MDFTEKMFKQLAKLAADVELQNPRLYKVDVKHDKDCPFMKGEGECNCDPEVALEEVGKPKISKRDEWI